MIIHTMKMMHKISITLLVLFLLFATTEAFAERIPTERGHWSSPRPMDRSAWNVFHSVINKEVDGVKHTPNSYSIQIVDGKRYRFYCKSTVVDVPVRGSSMITIFVHMGGRVELADIENTTAAKTDKMTESGKTFSSVTGPQAKWAPEPLYPRTGRYLQAPRISVRRL